MSVKNRNKGSMDKRSLALGAGMLSALAVCLFFGTTHEMEFREPLKVRFIAGNNFYAGENGQKPQDLRLFAGSSEVISNLQVGKCYNMTAKGIPITSLTGTPDKIVKARSISCD